MEIGISKFSQISLSPRTSQKLDFFFVFIKLIGPFEICWDGIEGWFIVTSRDWGRIHEIYPGGARLDIGVQGRIQGGCFMADKCASSIQDEQYLL